MSAEPKVAVTIVVPLYQRAAVVERTLDSVAAQTYRPLRLIIVDNGSTDGSLEVATRWAATHRAADFQIDVVSEPRRGAAAARNRGLAMVNSAWTMFFDSDDCMAPNHLASAMAMVAARPKAELVGWDVRYHSAVGRSSVKPFEPTDIQYHNLMHGSLATLRYFARTELFRRAGGWNEQAAVWDDIELGCRLLALNPVVVKRRGSPMVDVYHSPESITGSSRSRNLEAALHTLSLIRQNYPNPAHVDLKTAILLADCRNEGNRRAAALFRALLSQIPSGRQIPSEEARTANSTGSRPSRRTRFLCRLAYTLRRLRLPAAARLLQPLLG